MYQKIPINPGVYKDDSPLTAQGFFTDADKVRFRRGLPESMGGWELLSATTLTGKCRGITSWADNNLIKWLSLGTHTNLYGVTGSIVYDVTPVSSRGQLSGPFTTDGTTATIAVAHTSHGLINGQYVSWPTVTAINGATITSTKLYAVTVTTANAYTFVADSVSTSAGSGVGGTVDYWYYLAPGLADSIGALGYGAGLYSTGSTYSAPATGAVYPRTWSLANYGQNLLANPRGGALFEWMPTTSNTELVTNGTFTGSAAGWSLSGAGLAYSANTVAWTGASNGVLSQSITTPTNAFVRIQFDISAFAAGTLQVSLGGTNVGSAISANGRYWITVFTNGGASTLAFTGTGFTGTIDGVSTVQSLQAEIVPNAPTQNICMTVTPEGFVFVGGTVNTAGNFDPMCVRCSDIGTKTNAEQKGTASSTRLSRQWRLGVGSRIVSMRVANNELLVWTDKALYAFTYASNDNIVYSVRQVGVNCGLIGANAAIVLGGVAYWMSQGVFYSYSGGAPTPIPSGIQKDVYDNISLVQQDKIFAGSITGFNDVIWLIPDSRDGNECSRYALLCTQEIAPNPPGVNLVPIGVFAPGTFDRCAWHDSGVLPYPVAVSPTTGEIFYHEKGQSANGGAFTWRLRHGSVQTGEGATLFTVDTFIPDFKTLIGGATLTVYSYYYPQSITSSHGPFNIVSGTEKVGMLSDAPVGREQALEFTGSAAPAWMRAGHHMFDITDTGMTF